MTSAAIAATATEPSWTARILTPTLMKQCVGFMIGSAFFAAGSGLALWTSVSAVIANILYFIGSWFFTYAGGIQWMRSGKMTIPVSYAPGRMVRAEWLAAATQSVGTILFNISTGAALMTLTVVGEKHLVWSPDATGSVAFLVSGVFVLIAFTHVDRFWDPKKADWWAGQINFIGCVAFGVSAVAAFITTTGATVDPVVANWGTFIGAVGFFLASGVCLPEASDGASRQGE